MFRFEDLEIWKLALAYGERCYRIAYTLPKTELYSLGDQLRRAALSISNNIAEGSVGSDANFKKYLVIAIGSVLETVNILIFASNIGYIEQRVKAEAYEEAEKLIRKIRNFAKSLG